MALPKEVTFVSFDVYGTLIDWETGAFEAFQKEAERDGFTLSRDEVIPLFHSVFFFIDSGSYEIYSEVLPDSVPRWKPFKETNTQLTRFAKKYQLGLISNVDDKLLGQTRRHFKADMDLVVTAQQVRSYKPDPSHLKECARRLGTKKGWVHVAASYYHDVEPCLKEKVPVIWVNRKKEVLEPGQKKPTAEVRTLLEAAKLLGAA